MRAMYHVFFLEVRMPPWNISVVVAALALALFGCERQKATERVLEAVNPKEVAVTNGQAAILRLSDGYAAIVPTCVRHNEIKYRAFTSSNGIFQTNGEPVQEGIVATTTPVDVGGVRVFVGYGGENITSVMLDFGDNTTGIAVFATNDLRLLDVSRIEFKQGKPLNPQDLMKSIGENNRLSRTSGVRKLAVLIPFPMLFIGRGATPWAAGVSRPCEHLDGKRGVRQYS